MGSSIFLYHFKEKKEKERKDKKLGGKCSGMEGREGNV